MSTASRTHQYLQPERVIQLSQSYQRPAVPYEILCRQLNLSQSLLAGLRFDRNGRCSCSKGVVPNEIRQLRSTLSASSRVNPLATVERLCILTTDLALIDIGISASPRVDINIREDSLGAEITICNGQLYPRPIYFSWHGSLYFFSGWKCLFRVGYRGLRHRKTLDVVCDSHYLRTSYLGIPRL
jgi:hypothetical protein